MPMFARERKRTVPAPDRRQHSPRPRRRWSPIDDESHRLLCIVRRGQVGARQPDGSDPRHPLLRWPATEVRSRAARPHRDDRAVGPADHDLPFSTWSVSELRLARVIRQSHDCVHAWRRTPAGTACGNSSPADLSRDKLQATSSDARPQPVPRLLPLLAKGPAATTTTTPAAAHRQWRTVSMRSGCRFWT
jgi:hypothetical protein